MANMGDPELRTLDAIVFQSPRTSAAINNVSDHCPSAGDIAEHFLIGSTRSVWLHSEIPDIRCRSVMDQWVEVERDLARRDQTILAALDASSLEAEFTRENETLCGGLATSMAARVDDLIDALLAREFASPSLDTTSLGILYAQFTGVSIHIRDAMQRAFQAWANEPDRSAAQIDQTYDEFVQAVRDSGFKEELFPKPTSPTIKIMETVPAKEPVDPQMSRRPNVPSRSWHRRSNRKNPAEKKSAQSHRRLPRQLGPSVISTIAR